MQTLKKRADFVRLNAGRKWSAPGLVLQMRPSPEPLRAALEAGDRLRVGYTVTKKVGGAVVRNRAKRRLRAAAAAVLAQSGRAGHDYVLIGRLGTPTRPFPALLGDLTQALAKVHGTRAAAGPRGART